MELYEIVRTVRALQDINQKAVAAQLKLSPTAINRFEKGKSTLSREKLLAYANCINMDPQFLDAQHGNPFLSKDIIKIYLPEHAGFIDFLPVDFLLDFNNALEILLLIEEKGAVGKLFIKTIIEKPVYALAVKDSMNIYIMKRKTGNVVGSLDMMAAITETAIKENKRISYFVLNVSRSLIRRIEDWDKLHREDIEPLFEAVNRITLHT